MKKIYSIVLLAITTIIFAPNEFGQGNKSNSPSGIFRKCPNPIAQSKFEITKDGTVNVIPCPGKPFLLNGTPIGSSGSTPFSLNGSTSYTQAFATTASDGASFTTAGDVHTLNLPIISVGGTSRTNFLPYFTGNNSLRSSDIQYNPINFAVYSTKPFKLELAPLSNSFQVGDSSNSKVIKQLGDITTISNFEVNLGYSGGGRITRIGDYDNASGGTNIVVDDSNGQVNTNANLVNVSAGNGINLSSTNEISIGNTTRAGNETRLTVNDTTQKIEANAASGIELNSEFGLTKIGAISSNKYVQIDPDNGEMFIYNMNLELIGSSLYSTDVLVQNGLFYRNASPCKGTSTLSGGTVTISTLCASSAGMVFVQPTQPSGILRVTRNNGNFVVTSSSPSDVAQFYWFIVGVV